MTSRGQTGNPRRSVDPVASGWGLDTRIGDSARSNPPWFRPRQPYDEVPRAASSPRIGDGSSVNIAPVFRSSCLTASIYPRRIARRVYHARRDPLARVIRNCTPIPCIRGAQLARLSTPEASGHCEIVRLTAYDKRHRLSCFQRCFEVLLGLLDPDLEAAVAPLKAEAKAAPISR